MTLARQRRSVALKIAGTVALGAAVTLGVYSFFSKQSQTVDIVVAAKPLVPGEVPTKSDLAVEAVPQQSVTPGMIPVANVRVLNNQVVTTTIPQNAPVLVSELAPHLRGNYRVFVLTPSVIPESHGWRHGGHLRSAPGPGVGVVKWVVERAHVLHRPCTVHSGRHSDSRPCCHPVEQRWFVAARDRGPTERGERHRCRR